VNAELGVNSVADLVALAKRSKAGSLNFSSTGDGSIAHLGMLIMAKKLGIEMTHVPYKSTAQSIIDVASGVIQLQLATISPTLPLVQAGKVRVLGIASDRRSPLMPDVPTLAEQGAATTASFSLGFVFPTGTPEAIVRRSSEAFHDILQDETVRKDTLSARRRAEILVCRRNGPTHRLRSRSLSEYRNGIRDYATLMASIVSPSPTLARNFLGSNGAFAFFCAVSRVKSAGGSTSLSSCRPLLPAPLRRGFFFALVLFCFEQTHSQPFCLHASGRVSRGYHAYFRRVPRTSRTENR
jgi:hypothetical protein